MKDTLVLLGAGASYGSHTDKSILPPLATTLYDVLVYKYKELQNDNIKSLQKVFQEDFEKGLLSLNEKYPHFLSVFQRCMAHYFFQFGSTIPIKKDNLYYKLACELKNKSNKFSLVTLNYERIVELCFSAAGINLYCNQQIKEEQVEICFPHGCCHLFCEGIKASSNGVSFSGMNISTNSSVIALNKSEDFENRIRSDAMPPVMSYFEPSKMTTSGTNFITSQRERFKNLVSEAKKIIIIGIKIRLSDKHIWNPLSKSKAKLFYCSGSNEKENFENWTSAHSRKNDQFLDGYKSVASSKINP